MRRKTGYLFDREGNKRCNVLPLKSDMYQIVKIKDDSNIWSCGLNEEEFKKFKRQNKLYFFDELKQPTLFDN